MVAKRIRIDGMLQGLAAEVRAVLALRVPLVRGRALHGLDQTVWNAGLDVAQALDGVLNRRFTAIFSHKPQPGNEPPQPRILNVTQLGFGLQLLENRNVQAEVLTGCLTRAQDGKFPADEFGLLACHAAVRLTFEQSREQAAMMANHYTLHFSSAPMRFVEHRSARMFAVEEQRLWHTRPAPSGRQQGQPKVPVFK